MSTTMKAGGAGTSDMFADWETGVYTLEVTGLTATESTLYKNQDGTPKEQIEVRFVLPDVADPQDGTPLKRKTWLNAYLSGPRPDAKSPRARKGSQLWQLVRAASGVACVDEEEYDLDALCVGKLVRAIVKLNDKGYPSIDNDSFEPLRTKAAPVAQPARAGMAARPKAEPLNAAPVGSPYDAAERDRLAQQVRRNDEALSPAEYERHHELEQIAKEQFAPTAPPTRPLPPPPARQSTPTLRSTAQLERLFAAGLALDDPLDEAALDAWAVTSYGHGLAALTPTQCEELIAALGGAPF